MSSNCFERLALHARQLDSGIDKLTMTWEHPQVLIGRFAEPTDETNFHVKAVWNTIKNTQRGIEETLSDMKNQQADDSVSVDQILAEAKKDYEDIKQQCEFLNSVLAEYGYRYEEDDISDQTNVINSSNPTQSSTMGTGNLEVEFTPNLSWKYKVKSKDLTPAS